MDRSDTRLTDAMIEEYTRAGYWGDTTLTDLIEANALARPDAEAFVDTRTRISWKELWERSRRIAVRLTILGIESGDVVAVQLPNRVEFVCVLAAANHIGAVLCQYPPEYRAREVEFILGFSEAVAVVVPRRFRSFDYPAMIDGIRPRLPGLRHVIVVDDDPDDVPPNWTALRSLDRPASAAGLAVLDRRRPSANDIMRMAFTSGTTGDPKAVVHTYNTTIFTNREQNRDWGIGPDSRILQILPVGLNAGLFTIVQTCLAGCATVLMERFDPAGVVELIGRERITTFLAAPTALVALLNDPGLNRESTETLELVQTGGASTPIHVLREAVERLGCPVVDVYGMLEAGWTSCTRGDESFEEWAGSVGRPHSWLRVRLLDDDGRDVEPGRQGEIAKAGPTICVGYYHNPARNRESWTEDGWFRSGDLGIIDPTGRLRITGRKKDMIIHGGANIWPRELEEILYTHPKVLNAAVIGIPDEYFGENVCACVVVRPDEALTLDEIIDFIRGQISKSKLPQRLEVVSELPIGPTGKIQKHVLRDRIVDSTRPSTM